MAPLHRLAFRPPVELEETQKFDGPARNANLWESRTPTTHWGLRPLLTHGLELTYSPIVIPVPLRERRVKPPQKLPRGASRDLIQHPYRRNKLMCLKGGLC